MCECSKSLLPILVILLTSQVVEGKCECVDYERDWYVVVTSFASGLFLSALVTFSLICYCRRWQAMPKVTAITESTETLQSQNHDDSNRFYEELPDDINGDFEAIGSFNQTFRSDMKDSKTNLVVDVTYHGEPNQPTEYQRPEIEMETLYSDCGMVDDVKSASGKVDGTDQDRKSTIMSRYQQPRKTSGHTSSETIPPIVSWSKEALPSNQDGKTSMLSDYQHPPGNGAYVDMTKGKEAKRPLGSEPTSTKHQLDGESEYRHPGIDQETVVQPHAQASSTTDQLYANDVKSDYQHPKPSVELAGRESRREQEGSSDFFINPLSYQGENGTTSEYQHPKPSIERTGSERKLPPSACGQSSRTEQVDRPAEMAHPGDYQHPKVEQNTQEEEPTTPTLPPRSKRSAPTELSSQTNDRLDLTMKAPALPPRSLSQKSRLLSETSTSSEHPVKTSSLKLPSLFTQTTKTSGLSPSQKSPSTTSTSPPTLPPRAPKTVLPNAPILPPVPKKRAPTPPSKTKPALPLPSAPYAELNDLYRENGDGTENYQHLIPMQKH